MYREDVTSRHSFARAIPPVSERMAPLKARPRNFTARIPEFLVVLGRPHTTEENAVALENPAFANNVALKEAQKNAGATYSADQLRAMYAQPSAQAPAQAPAGPQAPSTPRVGGLSYDDVIVKTATTLGVVIAGALVGWAFPVVAFPAAIVGMVLGFVNALKREPSVPLILLYAVAQGLFIGGLSRVLEDLYAGIVLQAALATISVFVVMLGLFASGKVRASARATKIFLIAITGYALFSIVNVILQVTNVTTDPWGLATGVKIFGIPLGIVIGVAAVLLAAYSLVLDFDYAKKGVEAGIDRKYAWSIAFGLTVTLIWLYVEFLRLIAILRNN